MRYTILIADDEKISLHLLEKYLLTDDKNYAIHKAFDGKQALDIAKKHAPDLILLDWNMPLLNGEEVLKELRHDSLTKNIPVIIVSAAIDEDELQRAFDAGALDFIRKPIKKIELKGRINTALRLGKALKENEFQRDRIDSHIEELNKLSLIIKETDNSVILINTNGEIEWANEGFKRMYGISLEDFINRYGTNMLNSSFNKETIKRKITNVLDTGKSTSYISHVENFNTIKDKWIQTTLTPIYEGTEIDKIVAIESDITKAKKSELDLMKKNDEMHQLTEELQKTNEELEGQKNLIQEERQKTDELLESILPHHIAAQLKSIGFARPRNYKLATIMFTDFKGFTKSCEHLSPDEIVNALHGYFMVFDDIVVEHFIEKIKTIGDAYMCVGGIPLRNRSNPFDVVIAGLKIQHFMNHLEEIDPEGKLPRWKIRMGIHTGPIVAGVVGKIKFAYDVWGDSVNIASRMETACEVGRVNISDATYEYIKDHFDCEYRGEIDMKNRGEMAMYFVNRIKPEYSEDESGTLPNETFKKFLHSL
ncbi:MAG: response regulator [Bacteroidales bacterium]|nr:response regulator [Bacteroidales bacterium]